MGSTFRWLISRRLKAQEDLSVPPRVAGRSLRSLLSTQNTIKLESGREPNLSSDPENVGQIERSEPIEPMETEVEAELCESAQRTTGNTPTSGKGQSETEDLAQIDRKARTAAIKVVKKTNKLTRMDTDSIEATKYSSKKQVWHRASRRVSSNAL